MESGAEGDETVSETEKSLRSALSQTLSSSSAFNATIEAVRDLSLHAKAHTKPLDNRAAYFLKLTRQWNAHEPDDVITALFQSLIKRTDESLNEIDQQIKRGDIIDFNIRQMLRSARQEIIDAHTPDQSDRFQYRLAFDKTIDRRARTTVLHSSLLVSAVASFEVHVGNIVRAHMTAFPDSLTSSEISISTEYLQKFDTLQAFWADYRRKRVEKLMRGDVDSWLVWCEKNLRLKRPQLCPDDRELIEIFLTRNIHVHNAGRVNELYLASIARLGIEPRIAHIRADLPVGPKYLARAIDVLQVTGYIMTFGMLIMLDRKLDDEDNFTDLWQTDIVFALLSEDRNEAVLALTSLMSDIAGLRSEETQVNVWVALKETEGLEAIETAVRGWDTSELDLRFQLVKHALLDEFPEAHSIAGQAFELDELSRADWNSWPVLRGLRDWVDEDPDRGRFLLGAIAGDS